MSKGVFTSEFWWCVAVAICSLFFVIEGHVAWEQWVDLMKWLSTAYIGSVTVRKAVFHLNGKNGNKDGQGNLFTKH